MSSSSTPLRRRLLQYSLRTFLLVVAAMAVYLGVNQRTVHNRREMMAWMQDREWAVIARQSDAPSSLSLVRRMLGDQELETIIPNMRQEQPGDRERVKEVFPEATFLSW